jgi:hypothetical protein
MSTYGPYTSPIVVVDDPLNNFAILAPSGIFFGNNLNLTVNGDLGTDSLNDQGNVTINGTTYTSGITYTTTIDQLNDLITNLNSLPVDLTFTDLDPSNFTDATFGPGVYVFDDGFLLIKEVLLI